QLRIGRVSGEDRLQEFGREAGDRHQGILDQVREVASPRCGLDQHLHAVCEQPRKAERLAILQVVMDRMVIATRQLKGGEERVRLGPGWYVEGLADGEIL